MPHNCAVEGCNNRSSKKECQNISFHQLPLNDTDLLQQWAIKARLPQKLINRHSRICGAHFIGGKRSHANNVPQLFPWTPSRRQPPSRTLNPSPSCRPPVSRILLPPNLPPSPTLSSTLQPSPTLAGTLLLSVIVSQVPTRGIEHDHTYCKSREQELEKLSVVGADKVVLLAGDNTSNDDAGRKKCSYTMCFPFICILVCAVLTA